MEKDLFLQAILLNLPIELNLCIFCRNRVFKVNLDMLHVVWLWELVSFCRFFLIIFGFYV